MMRNLVAVTVLSLAFMVACGSDDAPNIVPSGNDAQSGDVESGDVESGDDSVGDNDTFNPIDASDDSGAPDTDAISGPDTGESDADASDTDASDTDTDESDTDESDVGGSDGDVADDTDAPDTGVGDTGDGDSSTPGDVDDASDTADTGDGQDDTDAGPPECDPPLSIGPAKPTTLPLDLLTFHASGGTGAYRFELVANGSDAIINELTGAYLSGDVFPSTDRVEVTDLGCVGSAAVDVAVVAMPELTPGSMTLPPSAALTFLVSGGSGNVAWSLEGDVGDATIDESGNYFAGTSASVHTVVLTDLDLDLTVDATITVEPGAGLVPHPRVIAIPVGQRFTPSVTGGSGHYEFTPWVDGLLDVDDGDLIALAPGATEVEVKDLFTALTTKLSVRAVSSATAEIPRAGDNSSSVNVASGDIDGDGIPDAILAIREADLSGVDSGGLYVYRGTETGLEPTPVRIIAGLERRFLFGSAFVADDFDEDGRMDIAVGAYRQNEGASANGAVTIYHGEPDAFFSELPTQVLAGPFGNDEYGHSLTTCDFNGDGWLDLAVGARQGEDRNAQPVLSGQGAIHIHLGGPTGFPLEADQIVYGVQLVGDTLEGEANQQVGWQVAAGDMDGDGACELAAHSLRWSAGSGRSNDGHIAIYKGVKGTETSLGGVTLWPVRIIAGITEDDPSGQLGRYLSMGDLTGDGRAELAASHYLHDKLDGPNNVGAARVWLGTELDDAPASVIEAPESADWVVEGTGSNDQSGWWVSIIEATGEPPMDLLVSDFNLETPDSANNSGTLRVFAGVQDALPSQEPVVMFGGANSNDRFGVASAPLGDINGDGTVDFFAWAGLDDSLGPNVGLPWFVPIAPPLPEEPANPEDTEEPPAPPERVALEYPAESAGARYGQGAAVVGDLDGDGFADLAVGAPNGDVNNGVNNGAVFIYRGTASGIETEPAATIAGYYGHSGGDQLGWIVAPAGDFDGDLLPDLAVLARSDDRPGNFATNNNYVVSTAASSGTCSGSTNNTGAILIFRGRDDGSFSTSPSHILYGAQNNQLIDALAGGLDYNGDGYGDVLFGNPAYDRPGMSNAGRAGVMYGEPADPDGRIIVICNPGTSVLSPNAGATLGRSIARLGDLDGDGCDEFVTGANSDDLGTTNQGTVRVIFGAGDECASTTPRVILLASQSANAQAGFSVAGGWDLDGDDVPDLVTGGIGLAVDGTGRGGAWLIRGAWIQSLTPEPLDPDVTPTLHAFASPQDSANLRVDGVTPGENFGRSVAIVPGGGLNGAHAFVVGGPLGAVGGGERTGGARVYSWDDDLDELRPEPILLVGGELDRAVGRLGETVAGGLVGAMPVVIMAGYDGSAFGLDQGSAWIVPAAQ